ncbi:PREDICTED: 30-kDa cleavage and polyadenylation specificity factor 30-like isoform X2 [Ipomoea nil]|uniref:30-kDa cleavage and polyadenylation specificity factor 30-like isoform X2 n=1 Tax=Ipomoea nil TaxID=35883 RepID=UPI0009013747|nr:PREDICTED: 30-kDa cleavage and polyadenylation specificity factor 30-like isoform X2 [Ipomoea nil]
MDDGDGGLSFDFEGGLDSGPTHPTASVPGIQSSDGNGAAAAVPSANNLSTVASAPADAAHDVGMGGNRRSFRQTVCRHWLRGLCMKGDACGFLHQYDKSRMPVCRFFRLYGECREQDCVYKHSNEDIKECNMYKLGFCPNGPDCRYRHTRVPGPPPPVEEVLQKIQQVASHNFGYSNRFFQNRNANFAPQVEKTQIGLGPNVVNQALKATMKGSPISQQQYQQQVQQPQQGSQAPNLLNAPQNQANRSAIPLPQGTSRYFIVKSRNRENLELSAQQGVWATQRSNEAKLNEAFDSVENVILIFSVNETKHFQGCAKMTTSIGGTANGGNWKYEHGTAHYGRNFSVKWLKLCELSFKKTGHLRNPYSENLPVKVSRDCQELEASVGQQLASLLYLEPDSELMSISLEAELKREEEKANGVDPECGNGIPDIVPFEDNEDEEEEESEEEDEGFDQSFGAAALGRGSSRGMAWPSMMPLGYRARPLPGMQGYTSGMMADSFSYGALTPRFSGDMMFHKRPLASGFGRSPFMGAAGLPRAGQPPVSISQFPPPASSPFMGAAGLPRAGQPPVSISQFPPPSQLPPNSPAKGDQRAPVSDKNDINHRSRDGKFSWGARSR